MANTIFTRDARDRAIDKMGFGYSYPLRDLPLNPVTVIVPFGCPARIEVHHSQLNHNYQLYNAETNQPEGDPQLGTSETIELVSAPITEDYRIFKVFVTEQRTELTAWLGHTATVKQGIDKNVIARLLTTPVDFNTPVTVEIDTPQEGVRYQLVDAWLNAWSNPITTSNNQTFNLHSFPLKENLHLFVHATNVDNGVKDILNTVLEPHVRPFLDVGVQFEKSLVDYYAPATILLSNVQPGMFYFWRLKNGTVHHPECLDPAVTVHLEGPPTWSYERQQGPPVIGPGTDSTVGALNPVIDNHGAGSGTTDPELLTVREVADVQPHPEDEAVNMQLVIPENFEDGRYTLHATRYYHLPTITGDGFTEPPIDSPLDATVQLNTELELQVRPRHDLQLDWQGPSFGSRQGFVLLPVYQIGVEYTLLPHDHLDPIDQPFTTNAREGINNDTVNLDFVVGAPGPQGVALTTKLLKAQTRYYVQARKLYNDTTVLLGATTAEADQFYYQHNQKPLLFNGTTAFATLPDELIPQLASTSHTIELWLRHTAPINPVQTLVQLTPSEGSAPLRILLDNSDLVVQLADQELRAAQALEKYLWTHIAFSYHKATATASLYINGQEAATGPWQDFIIDLFIDPEQPEETEFGSVYLAKDPDGNHFKGRMAEVRFWNVARKSYDIHQLFNRPVLNLSTQPQPTLVGYWPLNDGSGHTLKSGLPNGTNASKAGARWQ